MTSQTDDSRFIVARWQILRSAGFHVTKQGRILVMFVRNAAWLLHDLIRRHNDSLLLCSITRCLSQLGAIARCYNARYKLQQYFGSTCIDLYQLASFHRPDFSPASGYQFIKAYRLPS